MFNGSILFLESWKRLFKVHMGHYQSRLHKWNRAQRTLVCYLIAK